MDKLYWIVCEENDKTLFEGRFLGRTRNSALKHLKEQLGRSNMIGLVFSITEIPVPLIREIVQGILNEKMPKVIEPQEKPVQQEEPEAYSEDPPPSGATSRVRSGDEWQDIKRCYMEGRSPKDVSRIMNVSINTLRKRITKEGWAQERRKQ